MAQNKPLVVSYGCGGFLAAAGENYIVNYGLEKQYSMALIGYYAQNCAKHLKTSQPLLELALAEPSYEIYAVNHVHEQIKHGSKTRMLKAKLSAVCSVIAAQEELAAGNMAVVPGVLKKFYQNRQNNAFFVHRPCPIQRLIDNRRATYPNGKNDDLRTLAQHNLAGRQWAAETFKYHEDKAYLLVSDTNANFRRTDILPIIPPSKKSLQLS